MFSFGELRKGISSWLGIKVIIAIITWESCTIAAEMKTENKKGKDERERGKEGKDKGREETKENKVGNLTSTKYHLLYSSFSFVLLMIGSHRSLVEFFKSFEILD